MFRNLYLQHLLAKKEIDKYDIYAWGYENTGSMSGTDYSGFHEDIVKLPFKVDDICTSSGDGLVYKQGNDLYVLGGMAKNNLGLGENYSDYASVYTPIKIFTCKNLQKMEWSHDNAFYILDDGILYGSTGSMNGCFNDGLEQRHYNWDVIDTNVEDFSTGYECICYKKDNKLYHCGSAISKTNITETFTSQVVLEDASDVVMLKMNWRDFIVALTSDLKNAYIWGDNDYNRFSSSSTATVYNGEKIELFPNNVKQIFKGFMSSSSGLFYIDENNNLYRRGDVDNLFTTVSDWTLTKENCLYCRVNTKFLSTSLNGEGNITTYRTYYTGLNSGDNLIFTKDKIGNKEVKKIFTDYRSVDGTNYPYSFCLVG